jgi:homoserine dehydrogenase
LPIDFELAAEFGYRIKLLGIAKCHRTSDGAERIEARVQPTMVSASSLLAKVDGAMNAVEVRGNAVGPTLYYGAGAGEMPTASAVVADLMEIAREIRRGGSGPVAPLSYFPEHIAPKPIMPDSELLSRAYLRITVRDQSEILGQVTSLIGAQGVSIDTAMIRPQEGPPNEQASLIILTRKAKLDALDRALEAIEALPEVTETPRLVLIEEEG